MRLEINIMPAFDGECIWIRYGENKKYTNIIIDSGPALFARGFRNLVQGILKNEEIVDLLILTHIDNDHIMGFKKYLEVENGKGINKVWLNGDIGISIGYQAQSPKNIGSLVHAIKEKEIAIVTPIIRGKNIELNGAKITVITPTEQAVDEVIKEIAKYTPHAPRKVNKEPLDKIIENDQFEIDDSKTNKASISFILSYKDKNIAFLGDAHPDDVIDGKKLLFENEIIDCVKLAHHGSKYNTNSELIKCMKANKFIMCRKSVGYKETIARIVNDCEVAKIYCNYNWWDANDFFCEQDKENYINNGKLKMLKQDCLIFIE